MKKILLTLLFIVVVRIAGAYDVQIDGIYYNLYQKELRATVSHDGNCWDDNGSGYDVAELVVPETITHEGVVYIVKSIGDYAFKNTERLKNIVLSDSITKIGTYAFSQCQSIDSIVIPKNVVMVGSYAFDSSSSLVAIEVADSNKTYSSKDGILYDVEGKTLIYCPAGRDSVILPEGLEVIDRYAFSNCAKLEYVELPNSLKTISYYAFSYCHSLRTISIPDSVEILKANLFRESAMLESVVIGRGVTTMDNYLFYECPRMDTLTVLALDPPKAENLGLDRDSCVLRIFKRAYGKYQADNYWSGFVNVKTLNTLQLYSNNEDWGKVEGVGFYETDTNVEIKTIPSTDYEFVEWSDGNCDNPRVIKLTDDIELTAKFQLVIISSVESLSDNTVNIFVENGMLYIDNNDTKFEIYDMFGRLVYYGVESVVALSKGVYLIKIENIVSKILVMR